MRTAWLFCIAPLLGSAGEAFATSRDYAVPFVTFRHAPRAATADDVARQLGRSVEPVRVEEARRYLLHLYGRLLIKRSIALDGQVFDCMRDAQRPGLHSARLVTVPRPVAKPGDAVASAARQIQVCDRATFQFQRITLVDVMRFGSLGNFFSKDGSGGGSVNIPPRP